MVAQLFEAIEAATGLDPSPTNLVRVGRLTSPEAARAAFTQIELRRKAERKFSGAALMLFVREALEQASHEAVAGYHASLFPLGAEIFDLTAGIGGDSIALAARGNLTAFELDLERLELLRHNLNALGLYGTLLQGDGLAYLASAEGLYAFADPARRVDGRRTLDLTRFEPSPSEIAKHAPRQRLCATKLSPLLSDDALTGLGPGVEFVSFGGECREALVLAGTEAIPGIWAVHLDSGERLPRTDPPPVADEPGLFLHEADPAAIRAHALGTLCARALGDSNGYLTGDEPLSSVWLRSYRILWVGPGDIRRTRGELRKLNAGTPVVKQRHAGLDVESLRKQWTLSGDRSLVVAAYLVGKQVRHAILEPLNP